MRTGRDADRPWTADLVVGCFVVEIVVPYFDARIAAIADVHVTLRVGRQRVRQPQLTVPVARRAGRLDEPYVLVELDDAVVAVAVGHEDIAVFVPGDVSLTVERVRLVRVRRGSRSAHVRELVDRLRPPPQHHDDAPLRSEEHTSELQA